MKKAVKIFKKIISDEILCLVAVSVSLIMIWRQSWYAMPMAILAAVFAILAKRPAEG